MVSNGCACMLAWRFPYLVTLLLAYILCSFFVISTNSRPGLDLCMQACACRSVCTCWEVLAPAQQLFNS